MHEKAKLAQTIASKYWNDALAEGGVPNLLGQFTQSLINQVRDSVPFAWMEAQATRFGLNLDTRQINDHLIVVWAMANLDDHASKQTVLPYLRHAHPKVLGSLDDDALLAMWRGSFDKSLAYASSAASVQAQPVRINSKTTTTVDQVREILTSRVGEDVVNTLISAGTLTLVQSATDLPFELRSQYSMGTLSGVAGVTFGSDRAYLVADSLNPSDVVGVFLHEVGEHVGLHGMLGEDYGRLSHQFDQLLVNGDYYARKAALLVPSNTPHKHVQSERLAYLIESVAKDQEPNKNGLEGYDLGHEAISSLRTWLFRSQTYKTLESYGLAGDFTLTANDIASLARESVNHLAQQLGSSKSSLNEWFELMDNDLLQTLLEADTSERTKLLNGLSEEAALGYLYALAAFDSPDVNETLNEWGQRLHDMSCSSSPLLSALATETLMHQRRISSISSAEQQLANEGYALWNEEQSLFFLAESAQSAGSYQLTHYNKKHGASGDIQYNSTVDALRAITSRSILVPDYEASEVLSIFASATPEMAEVAEVAGMASDAISGEKWQYEAAKNAFTQWFQGSLATNHDGSPRRLFVTEGSNSAYLSPEIALFDTDLDQAMPCYVNIRKPLAVSDSPYLDLADIAAAVGTDRTIELASDLEQWITKTAEWHSGPSDKYKSVREALTFEPDLIDRLSIIGAHVLSETKYQQWFLDAGYDGVILGGAGDDLEDLQFTVFDQAAIRPALDVSDIDFSPTDAGELLLAQSAFEQWNEGNQIVDSSGTPIVLYHGTSQTFERFDLGKARSELNSEFQGDALFFSESPDVAARYATAERNSLMSRDQAFEAAEKSLPAPLANHFKNLVKHGFTAAWEKVNDHAQLLEVARDNGYDINEIQDLSGFVEGSATNQQDPIALFQQDPNEMPDWAIETALKLGFGSAIPAPNIMPVYARARNVLHTSDRAEAIAAKANGYDAVRYTGDNTVDGEAEWMIFDSTQVVSAVGGLDGMSTHIARNQHLIGSVTHPTYNPSFKRWFGSSKVLDAEGKPLVVYHGTASDFDSFEGGRGGFYFTSNKLAAEAYATYAEGTDDPRVIAAYLSLQNPLVLDRKWFDENVMGYGDYMPEWEVLDNTIYEAQEQGYDGIVLLDCPDFAGRKDGEYFERSYDQYIAFSAGQIKSAVGNNGLFSTSSTNIRFSREQIKPDFDVWFAPSVVRDSNGMPLRLYHGTDQAFTEFSADFIGDANGEPDLGDGFYFTDDPEVASSFASGDSVNVMPVYVRMVNPALLGPSLDPELQDSLDDDMGFTSIVEVLSERGHDGIIYTHKDGQREYVAFSSEQIHTAIGVKPSSAPAPTLNLTDAKDRTQSEAFKRWFGNSKVIDAEGKPKLVQHGTDAVITTFRPSATGNFGSGIYFADAESDAAKEYGEHVMNVYVSLQNPWIIKADFESDACYREDVDNPAVDAVLSLPDGRRLLDDMKAKSGEHFDIELTNEIKQLGYDGIIATYEDGSQEVVAFYPEQVKSADSNIGTFSKADADIRFSLTERPTFKKWFNGSKVVDDQGNPQMVFHGSIVREDHPTTPTIGNIFVFDRLFTTQFRSHSIDTMGSWFSDNPSKDGAAMYAGSSGEGSVIYPVYLSIKNPHETTFELMLRRARLLANGEDDGRIIRQREVDAYRNWLREMGKDGIKLVHDDWANNQSTEFANQTAWIALESNQIKAAYGNIGNFSADQPDIRFSFVGPKAANTDIHKLQTAKEMLDAGIKPYHIRRETGWFQGLDGMWRFEITDDQASFNKLPTLDEIAQKIEPEVTHRVDSNGLHAAVWREGTHQHIGAFGRDAGIARENLARYYRKNYFKGLELNPDGSLPNGKFKLSEVLNHPNLFACYPDLEELIVGIENDPDDNYHGAYYSTTNAITMNVNGKSEADVLSILLHEVQHAIQDIEKFNKGAAADSESAENINRTIENSVNTLERDRQRALWDNQPVIADIAKNEALIRTAMTYDSVTRLFAYANRDKPSGVLRLIKNEMQWLMHPDHQKSEVAREIQRRFAEMPSRGKARNEFIRSLAEDAAIYLNKTLVQSHLQQIQDSGVTLKSFIARQRRIGNKLNRALSVQFDIERQLNSMSQFPKIYRYQSSYEVYRNVAGEAEARLTQKRQHLTDDERAARLPVRDLDIDPEKAIVIFRGSELASVPVTTFINLADTDLDHRFSFAGKNALTANWDALFEAMNQTARGVDPELVRIETGWYQGVDRQWRFEIDDSSVTVKQNAFSINADGRLEAKLLDVLQHDLLAQAYPEFASVPVYISANEKANYTSIDENHQPYIVLGSDFYKAALAGEFTAEQMANALSLLLHETQHVIQAREGFILGGTESQFTGLVNLSADYATVIRNQITEITRNNPDYARVNLSLSFSLAQIERDYGVKTERGIRLDWSKVPSSQLEEYFALLREAESYPEHEQYNRLKSELRITQRDGVILSPNLLYERLVGEVEARNVQSRIKLTADERKIISPNNTADTSAGNQIVVRDKQTRLMEALKLELPNTVFRNSFKPSKEAAGLGLILNTRRAGKSLASWQIIEAEDAHTVAGATYSGDPLTACASLRGLHGAAIDKCRIQMDELARQVKNLSQQLTDTSDLRSMLLTQLAWNEKKLARFKAYETPAAKDLLAWNEPLPVSVQSRMSEIGFDVQNMTAGELYAEIYALSNNHQACAEVLSSHGVRGAYTYDSTVIWDQVSTDMVEQLKPASAFSIPQLPKINQNKIATLRS